MIDDGDAVEKWLAALEARHLADLRVPEVTRALRALSAAYVERRRGADRVRVQGTLDTAGKRAAFALFYAPLHFITVSAVVRALGAGQPPPDAIVDLGCGTGVAGAAWALAAHRTPSILGLERHPWALGEARWTYRQLGLKGQVRSVDLARVPPLDRPGAIVAGWTLNELADDTRARVEQQVLDAAQRGARLLVIEPIARGITRWWDRTAARVTAIGGRADEWRFAADLPPLLRMFDKAAGLDHRELTARTLYVP